MKRIWTMMLCAAMLLAGVSWSVAAESEALVTKTCSACHDMGRVQKNMGVKDQKAWTTTVDRMLKKGSAPQVTPEERTAIIEWLLTK